MSINQQILLQSIYDVIYDALTMAPSGVGDGRPALPRPRNYLSLALPGNPIDVTQFANQWSPENINGSMASAENFSTLVDPSPFLQPDYTPGGSVDLLYSEIVNANVAPPPPDLAGQEAYERAFRVLQVDGTDYDDQGRPITVPVDSPMYRNYQNKMNRYTAALTAFMTVYLQYDLTKPEDQRKWTILGPTLRAPVDQAYRDLQTARPGVIESALATVDQYQQSSLAEIFVNARRVYNETRKASLIDPNVDWHLCLPFPANWFTEAARDNFSKVNLNSNQLRLSSDSRFRSYGAGGGVNFGLRRIGASGSTTRQQYNLSTETKNMEVSFKFGRIEIRRSSWYRASLSSLRGWSVAGRSPGDYSNGRADNNPGEFALVPSAFILVRDVKIKAEWGTSDMQAASQATSVSANVGFGPFSLSGGYSNSSSSRRFASDFNGVTIDVPGASIVGWISTVQPFTPPIGGPPSVRAERRVPEVASQTRRNPYAVPYAVAAAGLSELDGNNATRIQEDAPVQSSGPSETNPFPESPVSEFVSAES